MYGRQAGRHTADPNPPSPRERSGLSTSVFSFAGVRAPYGDKWGPCSNCQVYGRADVVVGRSRLSAHKRCPCAVEEARFDQRSGQARPKYDENTESEAAPTLSWPTSRLNLANCRSRMSLLAWIVLRRSQSLRVLQAAPESIYFLTAHAAPVAPSPQISNRRRCSFGHPVMPSPGPPQGVFMGQIHGGSILDADHPQ